MSQYGWKSKTIRKVLKSKMEQWIKSINDEVLQKALTKDVIVTGGSITSMLMGDEIKDFDVYFKTKETTIAIAKYYCETFIEQNPNAQVTPAVTEKDGRVEILISSLGAICSDDSPNSEEAQYEDNLGEGGADKIEQSVESNKDAPKYTYRPMFLSNNAITLSDKVQLVIRFYGQPDQIHENYDYQHCKHVYELETDSLILNAKAMECILSKTLLYTGSLYPICSLFRMRKFLDRGWRISAGEIVKMSFQISNLDLKNINVLKEQLTGCDMMYMRLLINALEADKYSGVDIDNSYVIKLVDRIFND